MYSHKLISNPLIYQQKLIFYAQKFQKFVFLDSHSEIKNYNDNTTVNCIFAMGAKQEVLVKKGQSNFDALKSFIQKPKWAFGFLTYDLKNEIESNLESQNTNELDFPELYFFEPEILIVFKDGSIEIETENEFFLKEILDFSQYNASFKVKIFFSISDFWLKKNTAKCVNIFCFKIKTNLQLSFSHTGE